MANFGREHASAEINDFLGAINNPSVEATEDRCSEDLLCGLGYPVSLFMIALKGQLVPGEK